MINYKSIIIYLVLGVCTTVINVVAYYLCYEQIGISNVLSTIIAWVVAVLFAFLTNKPFVFGSHSWALGLVLAEGVRFFGCRLGTGMIEVVGMYLLVDILHLNGTLMKLLINVIVIILNYVFSKFLVFDNK